MFKDDVIAFFGSGKKVAKILGISPAAVSQWGTIIPEKNAYKLQIVTKGKLKVSQKLYKSTSTK